MVWPRSSLASAGVRASRLSRVPSRHSTLRLLLHAGGGADPVLLRFSVYFSRNVLCFKRRLFYCRVVTIHLVGAARHQRTAASRSEQRRVTVRPSPPALSLLPARSIQSSLLAGCTETCSLLCCGCQRGSSCPAAALHRCALLSLPPAPPPTERRCPALRPGSNFLGLHT